MTPVRAGVLGRPIRHSLSPVLHAAAYAEIGLPWTYDAHDVGEAELAGFLDGLDGSWAGLSLTMPLKRVALDLLAWSTPRARLAGAVNTVVIRRGRRLGANTDVPGMVAALAERGVTGAVRAGVVGGGATAASALVALHDLGVREVVLVMRRPEAAGELGTLAQRLGVGLDVRPWQDAEVALRAPVVVQTTPGTAAAGLAAALPRRPGALFDVVYDPWPTPLAAAWRERGGPVVGGLDLLVHQAVLQIGLMTGRDVPAQRLVAAMRDAGTAALRDRS
ncbi:MAG: shikimate dehydrogenase [Actinomycetota bacterium]|nr:shikimate dehydrogenase [Actinomycetota bacterium]